MIGDTSTMNDQADTVPVAGLTAPELAYLRPAERRADTISRRTLDARMAAAQGDVFKALRESHTDLHIRQRVDDSRGLTVTAVAESLRVTDSGLEPVSQP